MLFESLYQAELLRARDSRLAVNPADGLQTAHPAERINNENALATPRNTGGEPVPSERATRKTKAASGTIILHRKFNSFKLRAHR